MNSRVLITQTASFLIFCLLQVILFHNMNFYQVAFAFGYIGFILFLPIETGRMWVVILGFILGIIIDAFYDTFGVHAAATTLMAFSRGIVIDLIEPGGNEASIRMHPKQQGWAVFLTYVLILTAIHNISFLALDAYGMGFTFNLLLAMGATTLLNTLLVTTLRMFV